jgi:CRISPR system Cascade subunit CasA
VATEKSFNLLREPWILVLNAAGSMEEVGLLELFERAHEFRSLAGELPTQDVAILRLLLAILYCVYGRYDLDGQPALIFDDESGEVCPRDALNRWKELWDSGSFSHPILREYLENYEDRFWLFHPERPFYQVAGLNAGTRYSAAKLNGEINQSANKDRLFSSRSGEAKESLTYAEAARWLIHLIGFDDASAKPTTRGTGIKLPSIGVGWLGKLGLLYVRGDTLFETLMLNLVFLRDGRLPWKDGRAAWELDEIRTVERSRVPMPESPMELLTLQSRRVLLGRQNGKVVDYLLIGGDFFPEENAFAEQMTLWVKENSREGPDIFKPRQHDPAKQVWRDFGALVLNGDSHRAPGVISWLRVLKYRNIVKLPMFKFSIVGVKYDKSNSSFTDLFSDGISIHADLLNEDRLGEQWIGRIMNDIEITERLVQQVGLLAQNIAKAEGNSEKEGAKRLASEMRAQAYFRLDRPFRQWLEDIDPHKDQMEETSSKWWGTAQRIVRDLGKEMVASCHPRSFAERVVKQNGKELIYSIPIAYNQFMINTSSPDRLVK